MTKHIRIALVCLLVLTAEGRQNPAPRIVAIGDIHGDFDAFTGILQKAHLVDPSNRWSGGNATLVQTGDLLDRGPKARAVMDFLMALQKDAPRQSGRVIVLMGNHEAMNIYGDLRYVTDKDYASFADDRTNTRKPKADPSHPEGFAERCAAFDANGKYGKWLRGLPAVLHLNDSVYVHGGISPDLASLSVEKINEAIANEIRSFDALKQYVVDKKLAQPCSTLEELTAAARKASEKAVGKEAELLNAFLDIGRWLSVNENGPLWFRGYAEWSDADGRPQIDRLVQAFGVSRFVVGHTPQEGGEIVRRFDGKVYLIDTGMLSGYVPGGRPSALNIQGGQITTIY
jgi:hypothetical protein